MKALEYIVLKSKGPRTRSIDSGGPFASPMATSASAGSTEVEITQASLSPSDVSALERDRDVRAVAPKMPMLLIEPASIDESAPATVNTNWGVKAVKADTSPFDGSGIVVAVLDTGIDPAHEAFSGMELVQRNFTSESDNDTNGHGTHCAGTIFGRDVDGTRIGVATGVSKALIGKVLGAGGGDSATIANSIQWALKEGANVISMSLGMDFPGYVDFLIKEEGLDPKPATSIALEGYRANVNFFRELSDFVRVSSAFNQGSILIAAAGNESKRPSFEIAVAPPAASAGILSVAAVGESGSGFSIGSFSNSKVDVAGPGVDIISAKPGGGLVSMSGTSMAAPHVAGVAALWGQKLLSLPGGTLSTEAFSSKVLGMSVFDPLASNLTVEEVGQGLVQAPQ